MAAQINPAGLRLIVYGIGEPKAGIEGFEPLGGSGLPKTGPKHGQKIVQTHEFQAPPPEGVERWGRFPSIPTIGQILGIRAKTGSLNAWSDLESVRRSHCRRDSFEFEMP